MIKSIKNILFGRFIRSKPYTDTYERKTKEYAKIKTMAFLVDGSDPIALRELINYLRKYIDEGKKISFIGYVKKLPPFEDEDIIWVTNKDMNWIGIPKMQKIKHFIEKDFDVLINTSMQVNRPLEYISTYSKAALRIGKFDPKKTYCYDFMMRIEHDNIYAYLEQVEHYLKMVK